ncbi:hypothetical protein AB0M02_32655 [Actinoplanes sp. NPDC051861]|uniref:hypothetical protein n=1 Tax=Actinoplanes sp. NPDC051861 TaxID=3155170 RepID=UPI00341A92E7
MPARDVATELAEAARALDAVAALVTPVTGDPDPIMRLLSALEACRTVRAHVDSLAVLLADQASRHGASVDALGVTDNLYG